MKKVLLIAFFALGSLSPTFSQTLWFEDFEGDVNGATTGTATGTEGGNWFVSVDPGGTFERDDFARNSFQINNTSGEGEWRTDPIDIDAVGYAIISVTIGSAGFGFNANDYVRCYYIVDGGTEVLFSEVGGSLLSSTVNGSAVVSGSTLEIVIRAQDDTALGIIDFDDVTVTAAPVIYSRKNGDWTDVTGGFGGTGSWSLDALGGLACGCTPLDDQVVVIGGGNTINMNASTTIGALDIQNTGALNYSAGSLTLGINSGLVRVRSGASFSENGQAAARLEFTADLGGAQLLVESGATVSIDILALAAGATNLHYINGDGTVSVLDDILIEADGSTFVNNLSTILNVTDRVQFASATNDALFTNNGTITTNVFFFDNDDDDVINNGIATGNLIVLGGADDGNSFTNSIGATWNVGSIDLSNGNFTISNSGTINQTGNFIDVDTGSNGNFDNLATGVWNWALTPNTTYDTDMATVLDCSAVGNTFNYSGVGDQRIIPVQYGNLGLSGSGAKDANNANISVNGNWTQTGVTFTEGTGTVTFNGASAQVINNSTDNAFYNLTINKSAAANTVTMNNALTVSNTLTLTTGGLLLNGNQLNITRNNIGAMTAAANGYLVSESEASAVVWNTRAVTGIFTFPFRNAAGGTAIAVTFNKTSAGTESGTGAFAVSTYGTGTANTPYPSGVLHTKNATGVDISANVADRFWVITPSGYSTVPNATVTFRVTTAERPTGNPNLRAQRWNSVSSLWDAAIGGQTSTATSAQVAIPGTFSAWALSDASVPLPIELLSFEAQQSGNAVKLNWSTATELNNDFFTIERLNDADGFDVVLTHPGKGTTNEVSRYEVLDRSPRVGKNYYRLKQTDFDGQFSYSDIVMVEFASVGELLKVYPNPSNRKPLNLEVRALAPHQSVPIVISTVLGTSAFRASVQADANGYLHLQVPTTDWPTGLYLIQVGTETGRQLKVIID